MKDLHDESMKMLSDKEVGKIFGGASQTNKTPKYEVGTYVLFDDEKFGSGLLGVIEQILIVPEELLDQYPDGYVYVIHNAAGAGILNAWMMAFVAENRIIRICM